MAKAVEVFLHRHQKPLPRPTFPQRCVVCEKPTPATLLITHLFHPTPWQYWGHLRVPVCAACRGRFRRQRWGRGALLALSVGLSLCGIWSLPLPMGARFLLAFPAVAGVCAVWTFAEMTWPRFFDYWIESARVRFIFNSEECAQGFRAANVRAVATSDVPGQAGGNPTAEGGSSPG